MNARAACGGKGTIAAPASALRPPKRSGVRHAKRGTIFAGMLSVTGISKSFPGVSRCRSVDFSVEAGEIHALVGENGAGKSTLIKIISGAYVQTKAKSNWTDARLRGPARGRRRGAGIHVIYQELVLFPELTVAENVFISDQPVNRFGIIDYRRMEQRADDALRRLGAQDRRAAEGKELTVADQQMVEIARAFVGSSRCSYSMNRRR